MKKRTGEPWMPAAAYAHTLRGLTLNLLVRDVANALRFQVEVLGATPVYSDADFAVLRAYESEWMLHADHAYDMHALAPRLCETAARGCGVELRLHGCDPDEAEARARRLGYAVLAGAQDKPHGLREAFLVDSDGYVWVPDVAIGKS